MPNPFMSIGGNSPQMQAYLERNPNGFFASIFGNQSRPSDPNIGSNNGGVAIGSNGTTPTTQIGGPNMNPGGSNNADGFSGASRGSPVSMNRDLPAQHQMPAGSYRYSNSMVGQMGFRRNPGENHSVAQNTGMTQQPTSFAAGGMMTEDGGAMRPGETMPPSAGTGRTLPRARFKVEPQEPQLGAASPAPVDSGTIDQEAQRFIQQNPQEAQKVQALMAAAIQSGELTSQELNQVVQLAKTALANPASYPQIRQFAIKNGLGTEEEIPQQMDQGLLYTLIVIGKSMQAIGPTGSPTQPSAPTGPATGNAMTGQQPSPIMENGMLPTYKDSGGQTGDTAHLAKLHPREYVIPEKAVLFYGTEKFAKMIKAVDEAENEPKS